MYKRQHLALLYTHLALPNTDLTLLYTDLALLYTHLALPNTDLTLLYTDLAILYTDITRFAGDTWSTWHTDTVLGDTEER